MYKIFISHDSSEVKTLPLHIRVILQYRLISTDPYIISNIYIKRNSTKGAGGVKTA